MLYLALLIEEHSEQCKVDEPPLRLRCTSPER
jgi:hypothetical protein